MEMSNTILQLEQIQQRLLAHRPERLRPIFDNCDLKGKRAVLLIGPRGTGKTTWLLESTRDSNILYLSVDHPIISGIPLFEIAQEAFQKGVSGACGSFARIGNVFGIPAYAMEFERRDDSRAGN